MLSVQLAPMDALTLPKNGAPPEMLVPSSHVRVQLTSPGYNPALTTTSLWAVGDDSGGSDGGGPVNP